MLYAGLSESHIDEQKFGKRLDVRSAEKVRDDEDDGVVVEILARDAETKGCNFAAFLPFVGVFGWGGDGVFEDATYVSEEGLDSSRGAVMLLVAVEIQNASLEGSEECPGSR